MLWKLTNPTIMKLLYLGQIEKENTFFSLTFKVEENKVPSIFFIFDLRYGHFDNWWNLANFDNISV